MKLDITGIIAGPASAGTAVREIPIELLIPYSDHPFTLYKGERLDDMVQSVKTNGVLSPILVRELDGKYEILAGHNRTNAAKLAGLTAVPAVIKTGLSDEEADMYVTETNLIQRGFKELRISEQAAVVAYRHSKMFDEKKLREIRSELSDMEHNDGSKSKLAQVGEEYELSKNTIARLIRINKLLTACDKYTIAVDEKILSARAAVELSYISPAALGSIFSKYKTSIVVDNVWRDGVKIDMKLAEQLRDLFGGFIGTCEQAEHMLDALEKVNEKPRKKSFKVRSEIVTKYFDSDESDDYINDIMDQALEMYFDKEKA